MWNLHFLKRFNMRHLRSVSNWIFWGGGLGQGFRFGPSFLADRRERAFGEPLRHVKTNDQTAFRHGPGKGDPAWYIAGLWRVRYNRLFVCRAERAN